MKTITIECLPDGGVKIETTGFVGTSCEAATKEIEKALGLVKTKTKKPAYYAKRVGSQGVGGNQ